MKCELWVQEQLRTKNREESHKNVDFSCLSVALQTYMGTSTAEKEKEVEIQENVYLMGFSFSFSLMCARIENIKHRRRLFSHTKDKEFSSE